MLKSDNEEKSSTLQQGGEQLNAAAVEAGAMMVTNVSDAFLFLGPPRNPKPETRNPKPETRDQRPETRNPRPETRNPKPQTPNPKP